MKRIAIIGGGIAGVSAAYELARQKKAGAQIAFVLFEATDGLGGTVETERRDGFVIECGPDSWVTEKPGARDLALELGLESEIICSQDQHRKTYLAENGTLEAMPDGMRMMVPVEWPALLESSLFTKQAKLEYQREPQRAEELKANALDASGSSRDESVREFVIRHFGVEVADTIAAPLLAGVFGGDIATLSARAVLPAYVALERDHGSLILGLQRRIQAGVTPEPVFTTLRNGVAGLIEEMESRIPAACIRRGFRVTAIERTDTDWRVCGSLKEPPGAERPEYFDAIVLATPAKTTGQLLAPYDSAIPDLLPQHCSSAIVVALAFSAENATSLHVPRGFGFLVPQRNKKGPVPQDLQAFAQRALLACTFVDQKFLHRAPENAVLLRAFFGGTAASKLFAENDETLITLTKIVLSNILGPLPKPSLAVLRRWPNSLPLYTVGHLARIAELEKKVARLPHVRLIGNAYRGVGLPDLIRDGRNAAREIVATLAQTSA